MRLTSSYRDIIIGNNFLINENSLPVKDFLSKAAEYEVNASKRYKMAIMVDLFQMMFSTTLSNLVCS